MNNKTKCSGIIFGFDKDDKKHVGYIHVTNDGKIEIVDDEHDASVYSFDVAKKACEYVNTEEDLSSWHFHTIKRKVFQ